MKKDLFDEIVQFAIDGEQEAVDAYTRASEIVTRANVKSMLLGMARQEQMRRRKRVTSSRSRTSTTNTF